MNELARIDRLLADMKRYAERRGLAYFEVVMLDDIISAFENARTQAAEDHDTSLPGGGRDDDRRLDGGQAR